MSRCGRIVYFSKKNKAQFNAIKLALNLPLTQLGVRVFDELATNSLAEGL
jgi:hypothetical protein